MDYMGFPDGAIVKHLPANAGETRDSDLMPGSQRPPGVGNGNPFQYSGKFYGQGNRKGYSPWGLKELDMNEHACPLSSMDYILYSYNEVS